MSRFLKAVVAGAALTLAGCAHTFEQRQVLAKNKICQSRDPDARLFTEGNIIGHCQGKLEKGVYAGQKGDGGMTAFCKEYVAAEPEARGAVINKFCDGPK